jgi:hypothetical protein
MAHSTKSDSKLQVKEQRRARLAAELRANLAKRKAQARSRVQRDAGAGGAGTPEGGEAQVGRPGEAPEGRLT